MVILFTVIGAFFMPFLTVLLLYLNNRRDWVGSLCNDATRNVTRVVALALFDWIATTELVEVFCK